MYSKPDLMTSRIFKAKYGFDWFDKALNCDPPTSVTWSTKGILQSVGVMKAGLKKRLGNGRTIIITEDRRVGLHQVKFKHPGSMSDHHRPILVSELITTDSSLKAYEIWRYFDKDTAKTIMAQHIPKAVKEDTLEWNLSKTGGYDSIFGYWMLNTSPQVGNHNNELFLEEGGNKTYSRNGRCSSGR